MTKLELIQTLRDEDPLYLLELLDISSDELVDAFLEKIEHKIEYLYWQYEA